MIHHSICYDAYLLPLDDSGRWGTGGVFTALSNRSSRPKEQYEFAGRMKGKLNTGFFNLVILSQHTSYSCLFLSTNLAIQQIAFTTIGYFFKLNDLKETLAIFL